jgi:benzoyl-CoA reductase/2-hydroxyglutaryl-CoA dehydratase subunit BcrC/BadD/HgdB
MIDDFFMDETFNPEIDYIGWTCTYTPEEIIHAAGFQPVLIAESTPSTKKADAYLHNNLCPYPRSCLDFGLKNENVRLKGLVIAHSCNAMRIFYHYWSRLVARESFVHFLNVPKKTDSFAVQYFYKEIQGMISAIETYFEIKITEEALWKAVDVYNETRRLMAEISAMRKDAAFPLKSSLLFQVVRASQRLPRGDFNRELAALIDKLKDKEQESSVSRLPRILILGSILPGPQLLEIIEEAGAKIVYDDLCSGSRYFEYLVEKNGDPIQAISERYLRKSPCARMKDTDIRLENAREKIQEYRVDGVIYATVKFCDNHLYDFPVFKEVLEKANIPVLQIEEDFTGGNVGQIRTRVEAFVEML